MDIYEQIANQIEEEYLKKKEALAILTGSREMPVMAPVKTTVRVTIPAKRPEEKLTVPCQVKDCKHRVHASVPACISCTKKACRKCMPKDVCKDCRARGEM